MLIKQEMCQSTGVVAKRGVSQEAEVPRKCFDHYNNSRRLQGVAASA